MSKYSLPVPKNKVDIRSAPFHKTHKSMRHCIDFALPPSTQILAVDNGKVLSRESRFSKAYSDTKYASKTNYIEIVHLDGKVSFYVHLLWRSIKVRVGQTVKKGQVIGLSGQTGYATYPHLHFGLYNKKGDGIPIKFAD